MSGEQATLIGVIVTQVLLFLTFVIGKIWDWHSEERRRRWELEAKKQAEENQGEIMQKVEVGNKIAAKTLAVQAHMMGRSPEDILNDANQDLDDMLKRYETKENISRNRERKDR